MSRTSDLLPFKLRNIEQLRAAHRRRTMKLWISAILLVLAAAGTVSFVYELKFCQDFPGAQSCAWAHALGVTRP